MSIKDTIMNFISGDDYEDDYEPIVDNPDSSIDVAKERRSKDVTVNTTTKLQVVLTMPTEISELKSIGTEINEQRVVLLNLEKVSKDVGQRILDYLQGVAFANSATFKQTARNTFVIMPKNVEFSGTDLMSELESGGYSFN